MVYCKLHKSIVHLEWNAAQSTLKTEVGKAMTKEAFKDDLPLHMAVDRRAPEHIVISILRANPEAASVRGKFRNLPLHIAAQQSLTPNILIALIKAFPEGLDMLNDNQCTPRDFYQRNKLSQDALMRPTACWVEEIDKDEYTKRVQERIKELKGKIKSMKEGLAQSSERRRVAAEMIAPLEQIATEQEAAKHANKLREESIKQVKQKLDERLKRMKERINVLEEKVKTGKSPEEIMINTIAKRSYMENAQKRYEKVLQIHEEIKTDMGSLKENMSGSAESVLGDVAFG